ncbi:hypothetical protein FOCG_14612 [Fusarium oxysporum f. sp. radicis-lycopersici 26381]|nr:hypothetical protein FOZG_14893 [Fusarium oxysporum Fo47]EWZ94426.1 hypothetical protein FOWG_04718 [Fusarium oxysporum f. sp. lycopersici MN25]EXL43105.1 hypothetical protein FOCG_14612 [Fusarium oxysporum f. sp. radicis-lycopersici 26381]
MYEDAAQVVPLLSDALSESTGDDGDEDMENDAELLECEPPLKQVVHGHRGLFVIGGGGAQ